MNYLVQKAFILTIFLTSCVTMNIDSQVNSSIDFSNYHSFAWINRPKNYAHSDPMITNDIVEEEIIKYCNVELKARNYVEDTLNPDILLDYDLVTKNKVELQQEPIYKTTNPAYYNRNQYYNGNINNYQFPNTYVAGYNTIKVPYEEGTVTIYIIDRKSNKLTWQGWANGTIIDAGSFERELPRNIKAIFKKYPIKSLK